MSEPTAASPMSSLMYEIDPNQLRIDTNIDMADLTGEMARQPSLYAYYASNSVRAKVQNERLKRAQEILEAQLNALYRQTITDEKGKATEPEISACVRNDPKWKVISSRIIEAQAIYDLSKVAGRSLDQKRDVLLQMARDASKESAGPIRAAANKANKERLLETMKGQSAAIEALKPSTSDS